MPTPGGLIIPGDRDFRIGAEEVNRLHDFDDVDKDKSSHHHTLGSGKYQSAAGNHNHLNEVDYTRNEIYRRHYFGSTETYGAAWTVVPSVPAFSFTKVRSDTGLVMEMGGTGYLNTGNGLLHFGIRVTPPNVTPAFHEIGKYFFNAASDHRTYWGVRREVSTGFVHATPAGIWSIEFAFLQDANLFTVDLNDTVFCRIKEKP